jgi:hypothetical protein
MANQIEDKYFIKTTVNVRGKMKTYYTFEKDVILDKIGVVKLVISKRKKVVCRIFCKLVGPVIPQVNPYPWINTF